MSFGFDTFLFDLLAKTTDVHRDRRRVAVRVPPHGFQEILASERSAWMTGKKRQQVELACGQRGDSGGRTNLACAEIDRHRAHIDYQGRGGQHL